LNKVKKKTHKIKSKSEKNNSKVKSVGLYLDDIEVRKSKIIDGTVDAAVF